MRIGCKLFPQSSEDRRSAHNTHTKMFSKLFVASCIAALAVATPTPQSETCNTGPIQCCNSTQEASDPAVTSLLGLLGIVLGDVDALVGLGCSPITVCHLCRGHLTFLLNCFRQHRSLELALVALAMLPQSAVRITATVSKAFLK